MTQQPKPSFYMPNLNAVRAIAAMLVIICHCELKIEMPKPESERVFSQTSLVALGGIGVHIFFVLSGFLITYLLLREKQGNQIINIKDFYLRRILRIWPLYFLMLLLAYAVIPNVLPNVYTPKNDEFNWVGIILNIFFLSNVSRLLKCTPQIIAPIWSIAIEEQFYLFWPWIIRKKKAFALKVIPLLIVLIPVLRLVVGMAATALHSKGLKFTAEIIGSCKFDVMALGGLVAYIGFYKEISFGKLTLKLETLLSKPMQIISYIGFFVFLYLCLTIPAKAMEVVVYGLALFTALIILNLSLNPSSIVRMENRLSIYLGKISYGLYLLHMPVIYIVYYYVGPYFANLGHVAYQHILSDIAVTLVTVLLAGISYKYIETPFLKIKSKLVHIKAD